MFGEGVLDISSVLICISTCMLMPVALWGAFIVSARFPDLRGVAFGLVLGFAAYVFTGFLLGDLVGIIVAILVFGWVLTNQEMIQIGRRRFGNVIVFGNLGKPRDTEKRKEDGPVIEILPPDDDYTRE